MPYNLCTTQFLFKQQMLFFLLTHSVTLKSHPQTYLKDSKLEEINSFSGVLASFADSFSSHFRML